MARTTTSAATSTYKPSGYAANPSAQNSSYTGSSYAANPNAGKGTTSTSSSSSSYKPATGTTTASSYAASSGNTRSTYTPSSTTSAYEEAQREKFDQKKAESTPSSSTGSRTTSTYKPSSTTSAYEEAQKEKFDQKKAESTPSSSTGSRTPAPSTGRTPAPSTGRTPAPSTGRTPAPSTGRTPAPSTGRTPAPSIDDSRTPAKTPINGAVNEHITPPPSTVAPTPVGGGDKIALTLPEIEAIIQKLRASESRLREIWGELINNYIRQIENSWAGPDAEAYIAKVKAFEPKVENIAQALSLLADTYQRVITRSQDVQQQVLNVVNNY